jgi:hypothetical protein
MRRARTCVSCGEALTDEPGEDCEHEDDHIDLYEGDEDFEIDFADPGGRSALRAETPDNPRDRPCPTCGAENVLTPADVACGYQCNSCADRDEGINTGGDY